MNEFTLRFTKRFDKEFSYIKKKDSALESRINDTLSKLTSDPFSLSLHTHKANTTIFGKRYSSKVTGDIRIIWDFMDNRTVILAITIGGHSGKRRVYK